MTIEEKRWEGIREIYKDVELSKYLMEEYVLFGGIEPLLHKYGKTRAGIYQIIRKYLDEIQTSDNSLYKEYLKTMEESTKRARELSARKQKESMENFRAEEGKIKAISKKILQQLPKKIKYDDFRDFILNYRTGDLTGEQLVKMANKQGIEIYDIIDGQPKLIRL